MTWIYSLSLNCEHSLPHQASSGPEKLVVSMEFDVKGVRSPGFLYERYCSGGLSAQALSSLSMIPTWTCRRLKRKQCSSRYDAMWRFDGRRWYVPLHLGLQVGDLGVGEPEKCSSSPRRAETVRIWV